MMEKCILIGTAARDLANFNLVCRRRSQQQYFSLITRGPLLCLSVSLSLSVSVSLSLSLLNEHTGDGDGIRPASSLRRSSEAHLGHGEFS
jgi:hypothetical protein